MNITGISIIGPNKANNKPIPHTITTISSNANNVIILTPPLGL